MPYIGRDLNRGNYLKLDDISSSFNSSTTTFNLTVGGSAFTPGSSFSILVSVGGVIQEPESAYQVNNSEIIFANAPTAQDSFFCIALAVPIGIGVPGNGTVNGTQMAKPFNYDGFFFLDDANNRVGINSSSPTVALDIDGIIKASSFTGGSGGINAGVVTCTGLDVNGNGDISGNLVLGGDLTVNGTTSTIDTNLIGVDRIEVGANSSTIAGIAVTQSGSADILRLYDGSTQVVTIDDEGNVGVGAGAVTPHAPIHIRTSTTGAITTLLKLHGPFTSNTGSEGTSIDFGTAADTSIGARIIGTREAAGAKGALRFCTGRENDSGFNDGHMVIDETGTVGIGSATPLSSMALDVIGSIRYSGQSRGANGTNAEPSYAFYSDHDSGMYRGGTNILSFATAGVERFRIDSAGTVEFHGGDQGTDHIKVNSEAGGGAIFISNFRGVTDTGDTTRLGVGKNNNALIFMNASGSQVDNFVIGNTDAVPLIFSTANIQRIHIGATGNVGIKSTAPRGRLDIQFDGAPSFITFGADADNPKVEFFRSTGGSPSHYATEFQEVLGDFVISTAASANLGSHSYSEKLRIFSSGNLGVGDYSSTSLTHAIQALRTSGTTVVSAKNTNGNATFYAEASNGNTAKLELFEAGTGGYSIEVGDDNAMMFKDDGDEKLRIKSGGDLYLNSSTALTSPNTGYRHISISNNAIFFAENNAGGFTGFTNNAYLNSSGNWVRVNNDHASVIGMDDGVLTYRKAGAGTGNITWEEGFRVDSQGNFTTTQQATYSRTNAGFTARRGDSVQVTRAAGTPLEICRTGSDGAIIGFFNDSTNIGGFKISGNDLAYNRYVGGDAEIIHFDGDNLKVTTASDLEIGGVYKGPQDYPNVKPIFDFNFAKVKKLDSRFRCYRTGGASYVDEFGYIKIASYNAPRFDHDPITRECKGLLIEPSRENKISYSHAYSPSGTGTVDSYTEETRSPDGEYNAKKITRSAGGGSYNEGTSTTGVFSVFLKAGSTNYVQIQGGGVGMNNSTIGPYTKNTVINLSNGTFTVNEQGFTAKQYRDGWWRVSVVYTTGSTYQGTNWSIYCLDSSSPSADTVADGEHCYAWGQVFEVGSFITSYIPSGPSSQNTRGNENIRIGNTEKYNEFTDMFNAEEGTVITEHEILSSTANQGLVGFYKDFGTVDRIELRATGTTTTRARFEVVNTSSSVASLSNTSLAHSGTGINKNNKYAFAFKVNDFVGVVNGGTPQTDTSGNVPTGLNGMIVGNSVYTVQSHLYIKRLTLYSQRLSNNQMQNLTS